MKLDHTMVKGKVMVSRSNNIRGSIVVFAIFLCTLINYIDRVNISVTAPLMIKEYGWSTTSLGVVFSSFFWGYFLLQIPAGWLADKIGGRRMLVGSTILWSIFTFLTSVPGNILALTGVRAALGASEAVNYPAQTSFIARHMPRAPFSRIQGFNSSAISLGVVLATPLAVFCMTQWGWRSVFYIFAALSLLWAVFWVLVTRWAGMTDGAPAVVDSGKVTETVPQGIFENPLAELEVWGSSMAWYSNSYVFYFFMMWLPTYFMRARGMSMAEMAGLATVPYLILFCMINIAGYVVELIKKKSTHSIFWRRMIFAVAFVWCAIAVFPLQYVETSREAVVLISLAFVGLSFTYPIAFALPIEYAPRRAGVVMGFMNSWGQVAGILAPIITGAVIADGHWERAFLITAAFSLLGALLVALTSHYSTGATDSREVVQA
jgi:MFS family permease